MVYGKLASAPFTHVRKYAIVRRQTLLGLPTTGTLHSSKYREISLAREGLTLQDPENRPPLPTIINLLYNPPEGGKKKPRTFLASSGDRLQAEEKTQSHIGPIY